MNSRQLKLFMNEEVQKGTLKLPDWTMADRTMTDGYGQLV